jgi:ATP-dependent exoDNAse (exonuclease V) beta subunit
LNEIRPGERSLSTAVLVKTNDQGKAVVDLLRRSCPGMTIVHEGKAPILDNPVVQTLLALIKVAAHPGDRFAWRQVQMSPLGSVVTVAGFTRKTCSLRLLRELRRDGFQAFVRHWGEELNKAAVLDAFGRKRLDDLAAAGGMYDATGESECNRFLRFIEHHQTSEQGDDDVVRVMTVHQSKGLGFDIVILPELMKESMVKSSRIDMLTRRDETTGQPEWILQAPPRTLAEVDDVLSAAYEQEDARDAFESLCALYVAMTRAKRGLYLITSFPGKSSKTFNEATLVKEALVGNAGETDGKEITINGQPYALLYEEGTPEWFTAFKTRTHSGKTEPHHELPADFGDRPSRRKRLARISPSLRAESPEPASLLFEDIGHRTRQLGTAVHALLERVGWIDDLDLDALLEEWKTIDAYSDEEKALAAEHARHVLTTESCRKALERPSADAELWRERMFEIVLDDDWVTGAFDRVVLLREPGGEITGATILDYKSNRVEDNKEMRKQADKYRPQLELYRDVLARMLAIDPSSITLQLLFTWPAEVVTL